MASKKYYWLKLKKDFFKRHDIQVVENMPNGKDYVLFYLKLLCESVDHEGNLRFSEEIPYNEEMLSAITNTNIDTVRSAIKLFTALHLMEMLDDGTLYMSQVEKMIGGETYWAEQKRQQRLEAPQVDNVHLLSKMSNPCPTKRKSIEKEQEKEKETIYSEARKPHFTPPTVADVEAYGATRDGKVDAQRFVDFYASKGWKVGKTPMKDWKAAYRNWERTEPKKAESSFDVEDFFDAAINKSYGG